MAKTYLSARLFLYLNQFSICMNIDQIINNIAPLGQHAKAKLTAEVTLVSFPKSTILLKAEKVEQDVYFIKKGVVRAFSEFEEGEITFWFGEEGETVLSMRSYIEQQKSYENIELLEDCDLYKIRIDTLKKLYQEDIEIANWGRILAEKELLKIEGRMISRELLSAKQRYDKLMEQQSSLLQRVPLKYIASYLGITQVSLSRIRSIKQ